MTMKSTGYRLIQFALPAAWMLLGPACRAEAPREDPPKRDWLITVVAGAQFRPGFPGDDRLRPGPLGHLDLRHVGDPISFNAPGQSPSFGLLGRNSKVDLGPVINLQQKRKEKDVGAPVGEVARTIEAGAFVQAWLLPGLRVRAEGRKGLGGHRGWVGLVSADWVIRDGDQNYFSIGPRLRLSDARYQRAYFGVTPAVAVRSGLPAFRPGGGVDGVGMATSLLHQFDSKWGVFVTAGYDRLIRNAAVSPIVRGFGSRNQYSAGLGLAYTFTIHRR